MVEFRGFGKIPRGNPLLVTITEKINGTNACIIVNDGEVVGVQSRKRMITPEKDNYGFAAWVEENKDELAGLEDGYHFGEWAGLGIQKNPHNLDKKTFFLFNTTRWADSKPPCCEVVPVLYSGELMPRMIDEMLAGLERNAADGETPEGIVVYHHLTRSYTKHTIIAPDGKWKENKC